MESTLPIKGIHLSPSDGSSTAISPRNKSLAEIPESLSKLPSISSGSIPITTVPITQIPPSMTRLILLN